jgi:peptidoglycan/LPS O-acetylase OafA/YrhL
MAESPNPTRSWTRLDGVDVLRGLSIFFVLMNHVNIRLRLAHVPYTQGLPDQLVSSLVWNGQRGVQIFFAISGFLITSTTLRRWGSLSRVSIRDFYLLRFARIAPLFLLLISVLSVLHLAQVNFFVIAPKMGGLGRALFAALTFHVNVLEANRGYLPANWDILWSLSVEEMFYLFFPLLCVLLGRRKLLVGVLLAFVVIGPFGRTVLAHGNEVWIEYSYLGGMDAIALGCLTALVVARKQFSRPLLRTLCGLGTAILVFCLCFSNWVDGLGLGRNGPDMTLLAVGACLIIAVSAQTRWSGPRVLSPLLSLGQRSYEVYLTHMFVVFACLQIFLAAGKPMAGVPVFFIAVILISSVVGEAVARFYSEPMNRLLRSRWGDGPSKLGSVVALATPNPQDSSRKQTVPE